MDSFGRAGGVGITGPEGSVHAREYHIDFPVKLSMHAVYCRSRIAVA